MIFKDFFYFSYLCNKIKLDKAEEEVSTYSETVFKSNNEDDTDIDVNEWHHEYELIYRSYVLER